MIIILYYYDDDKCEFNVIQHVYNNAFAINLMIICFKVKKFLKCELPGTQQKKTDSGTPELIQILWARFGKTPLNQFKNHKSFSGAEPNSL